MGSWPRAPQVADQAHELAQLAPIGVQRSQAGAESLHHDLHGAVGMAAQFTHACPCSEQ
jgi:hypothetical protein